MYVRYTPTDRIWYELGRNSEVANLQSITRDRKLFISEISNIDVLWVQKGDFIAVKGMNFYLYSIYVAVKDSTGKSKKGKEYFYECSLFTNNNGTGRNLVLSLEELADKGELK